MPRESRCAAAQSPGCCLPGFSIIARTSTSIINKAGTSSTDKVGPWDWSESCVVTTPCTELYSTCQWRQLIGSSTKCVSLLKISSSYVILMTNISFHLNKVITYPALAALSWVAQKPEGVSKVCSCFNPQDLFLKPAWWLGEAWIAVVFRLQPMQL